MRIELHHRNGRVYELDGISQDEILDAAIVRFKGQLYVFSGKNAGRFHTRPIFEQCNLQGIVDLTPSCVTEHAAKTT